MIEKELIKVTISVTNADDENSKKQVVLPTTMENIRDILDEVCNGPYGRYCCEIVDGNLNMNDVLKHTEVLESLYMMNYYVLNLNGLIKEINSD